MKENMDKLTLREDWINYWSKRSVGTKFRFPFTPIIPNYLKEMDSISILEVGGFPGSMIASFSKELNTREIHILDYMILPEKVKEVESEFGLVENSINMIESDFFNHQIDKRFDLVCSFGFIEHFEDPKNIISKHLELCAPSGAVFITMPNFRGINGLVQKFFDPPVFRTHNIKIMNINYMYSVLDGFDLTEKDVFYFGRPNVWLDATSESSRGTRLFVKILGKALGVFKGFSGRLLSPHICILIKK